MIQFVDVQMLYPGRHEALRNLSLDIPRGSFTFVTGHSGAGKSTLLRLIALMERQSRGQVIVEGQSLERIRGRAVPYFRRKVGFIFQDHRLLADRSVFDNVALPLVITGHRHREIARRVRAALDKVDLLAKERVSPSTLSSGEQQRVGIARAVVHRPPILLADEPTGNLDPELSLEIMRLFEGFHQVGVTVVIASHDHDLVRRLGYPALVLRQGALIGTEAGPLH